VAAAEAVDPFQEEEEEEEDITTANSSHYSAVSAKNASFTNEWNNFSKMNSSTLSYFDFQTPRSIPSKRFADIIESPFGPFSSPPSSPPPSPPRSSSPDHSFESIKLDSKASLHQKASSESPIAEKKVLRTALLHYFSYY